MNSRATCFLCDSDQLRLRGYINLRPLAPRAPAYAMPDWLGGLLSSLSRGFASAYRPVRTNKKYFDTEIAYCNAT